MESRRGVQALLTARCQTDVRMAHSPSQRARLGLTTRAALTAAVFLASTAVLAAPSDSQARRCHHPHSARVVKRTSLAEVWERKVFYSRPQDNAEPYVVRGHSYDACSRETAH